MSKRILKFLFLIITCFFLLKGLAHSSTEDHSVAARTNSAFGESNFTGASESNEIAVGSDQYDVQSANNIPKVSPAPTRESPIVEAPINAGVEVEGDHNSGPGVAPFILFFVVIAWLTTAGGPNEN
jgi:hypothetical protein